MTQLTVSSVTVYLFLWPKANEWNVELALKAGARASGDICYWNWAGISLWPAGDKKKLVFLGLFFGPQIGNPWAGGNYQYLPSSLTGILSSEHIQFRLQCFLLSARLGNRQGLKKALATMNTSGFGKDIQEDWKTDAVQSRSACWHILYRKNSQSSGLNGGPSVKAMSMSNP